MNIIWGVILLIISSVAFFGQLITVFRPGTAARLGLTEIEAEVDAAFYADVRGEAAWDVATLWTVPIAAVLLLADNPAWAYFGLAGGGMQFYFAGRGIVTRQVLARRGIQIGKPETVRTNLIFLILCGLAAVITMVMATSALPWG